MLGNSTTTQGAELSAPSHLAPVQKPSASQKLEHSRRSLRFAQRSVTASEGRLLDFDTTEEINRTLAAVSRDLEEVQISVAVMERKVCNG